MYGKVSIVMPNYNCERFIRETIKLFVGKLRKAFGSLIYDKSMSGDLASYNICDFDESIALTEIERR